MQRKKNRWREERKEVVSFNINIMLALGFFDSGDGLIQFSSTDTFCYYIGLLLIVWDPEEGGLVWDTSILYGSAL